MDMKDCVELQAALAEVEKAYGRVGAICERIAAGQPAGPKTEEPIAAVKRRGGRRTGKGPAGSSRGVATAGGAAEPKGKKEYAKKVKCAACGTVTGSQLIGDKRMPVKHADPATGGRCKGIFMAAELVAESQTEA